MAMRCNRSPGRTRGQDSKTEVGKMLNWENFRVLAVASIVLAALGHAAPALAQAKSKAVPSIFDSKEIKAKSLKKFKNGTARSRDMRKRRRTTSSNAIRGKIPVTRHAGAFS